MPEGREPDLLVSFLQDLAGKKGGWFPDFLLDRYKRLGITELEMMVLVHLWRFAHRLDDPFPSIQRLHELMAADAQIIKGAIASLIEKKLLGVVSYCDPQSGQTFSRYVFDGMLRKLIETWLEESRETGKQALDLVTVFEREFGRPLSPVEIEQLSCWVEQDKHQPELIAAALKRAVLRGVYNFRYINSILHQWARNNVRTPQEADAYEERFFQNKEQAVAGQGRRQPRRKQDSREDKRDKYKDVYLT